MIHYMRKDIEDSRAGRYRQSPKKSAASSNTSTSWKISDDVWKSTADHAEQCVRNFYHAPVFQTLRKLPATAWPEIEDRSTVPLDGLNVYVQLDRAFRSARRRRHPRLDIPAKPDAERNNVQLACYLRHAIEKRKVTPEAVSAVDL